VAALRLRPLGTLRNGHGRRPWRDFDQLLSEAGPMLSVGRVFACILVHTMVLGRRWLRVFSIHRRGRSGGAARSSDRLSHFVSNRLTWLAEEEAWRSSQPASRPSANWRSKPTKRWRTLLPEHASAARYGGVGQDHRIKEIVIRQQPGVRGYRETAEISAPDTGRNRTLSDPCRLHPRIRHYRPFGAPHTLLNFRVIARAR